MRSRIGKVNLCLNIMLLVKQSFPSGFKLEMSLQYEPRFPPPFLVDPGQSQ